MDRAAAELERERGDSAERGATSRSRNDATGPNDIDERPEIALPEEEGHPHGQFTVAYNPASGQTWGFNFVEYPWRGDESVRDAAAMVDEFAQHGTIGGDSATCLEFTSPHDGRIHCLTREGARRVLSVDHARTMGQVAPHSEQVNLVRVTPAMLAQLPPALLGRRPTGR